MGVRISTYEFWRDMNIAFTKKKHQRKGGFLVDQLNRILAESRPKVINTKDGQISRAENFQ